MKYLAVFSNQFKKNTGTYTVYVEKVCKLVHINLFQKYSYSKALQILCSWFNRSFAAHNHVAYWNFVRCETDFYKSNQGSTVNLLYNIIVQVEASK